MNFEKLEQLVSQREILNQEIFNKQEQLDSLDAEIQMVEAMKTDVDGVPNAVDSRKIEILKYYDPKTDVWSKESDDLFSAADKTELEKLYNEKVQLGP